MKCLRKLVYTMLGCLVGGSAYPAQPKEVKEVRPIIRDILYTPNSSVIYSNADITKPSKDHETRLYTRYFSLYNIPRILRDQARYRLSFKLNSFGKRKQIYVPDFVPNSDKTVVVVDLRDYEIDPKAWDDLGKNGSGVRPFPEPYFHTFFERVDTQFKDVVKKIKKKNEKLAYYDHLGRAVYTIEEVEVDETTRVVDDSKKVKVLDFRVPWIELEALLSLVRHTGTDFPIFRADWFIVNASVPPAYYNLLNVGKKLADFEKLIFADEALAAKARSQTKGVAVTSSVARNNRTLTRSPTFTGGYYWISHDTLKSTDDRDYVRIILDEKFDVAEVIASLPNGLQAYYLADAQGNRQDAAPTDVAIDSTSYDKTVRNGRSCMICHNTGIHPIDDEIRRLTEKLTDADKVSLFTTIKEEQYRLRDLFGSNLDKPVKRDQDYYAEAVALATGGMTAEQNAAQFASFYDKYAEETLKLEDVARETALTMDDLEKYIAKSNDPHILGLTKKPIRPLRRDQWEQSFAGFMAIIYKQE